MVLHGYWKYQGDHFVKYMIVQLLCCIPETNTNNIECKLKNKIKKRKKQLIVYYGTEEC